jgi:hypothetical protein
VCAVVDVARDGRRDQRHRRCCRDGLCIHRVHAQMPPNLSEGQRLDRRRRDDDDYVPIAIQSNVSVPVEATSVGSCRRCSSSVDVERAVGAGVVGRQHRRVVARGGRAAQLHERGDDRRQASGDRRRVGAVEGRGSAARDLVARGDRGSEEPRPAAESPRAGTQVSRLRRADGRRVEELDGRDRRVLRDRQLAGVVYSSR